MADIKNLTFTYTDREGNETETALSDIAQFEEGYTLGTINRDAQTRYISVTAGVDDDHNVSLLSNEIQKELDKIDLPEGYSIEMAGEDEMIADAMNQLYLMLLVTVGGLLYGTLLTLIVVPCIYDAFNRNKSMVEEDL